MSDIFSSQTLIQCAVVKNDFKAVEELLKKGNDINNKYYCMDICGDFVYGLTPLHVAVGKKNLLMAKYLLINKADVNLLTGPKCSEELVMPYEKLCNVFDFKGLAPIHIAVMKQDQKMVELLIRYNADLNIRDETGKTPLEMAVNNSLIAAILIINGADIDTHKFKQGKAPLIFQTIDAKNFELTLALSEILRPRTTIPHLKTTIPHLKTTIPHLKTTLDLTFNNTPVLEYAMENFPECVECLIENDCFVRDYQSFDSKETALHLAIRKQNDTWLRLLIEKEFNVNAPDIDNNYPLHYAVYHELPKISMLRLIAAGADPNLVNRFNYNPLIYAAEDGNCELLDVLLRYGAKLKPNLKELENSISLTQGKSALLLLDYIKHSLKGYEFQSKPILWFFVRSCIDSPCDSHELCQVFRKLIDQGCDLNSIDPRWGTLLHFLIYAFVCNGQSINEKLFNILCLNLHCNLDQVFEPKEFTLNGQTIHEDEIPVFGTPLTFALSFKNTDYYVKHLVLCGADLNTIQWPEVHFGSDKIETFKIMFYLGFKFTEEHLFHLNPENNEKLSNQIDELTLEVNEFTFKSFKTWLKHRERNVWTLKEIVRYNFYKNYGRKVFIMINQNIIPCHLHDFISFVNLNA